jgi:hypothetical protein
MLPAAALALVLAGCFVLIRDDSSEQRSLIGSVRVDTSVCPALPPFFVLNSTTRAAVAKRGVFEELGCMDQEDIAAFIDDVGPEALIPRQVLLAYRVPSGADVPETLTSSVDLYAFDDFFTSNLRARRLVAFPDPTTQTVTFRRSSSLEAELPAWLEEGNESADPEDQGVVLPGGSKLVGYISDVVAGQPAGDLDVEADFGLPAGPDEGQPYTGPFNHLTLAGVRAAFADDVILRGGPPDPEDVDPARPVVCDPDIEDELTFCPVAGTGEEPWGQVLEGTDLVTRDLRVVSGQTVTVEQGQTANVPFAFRAAGPAGDQLLSLAADVSIQDGKATPVNQSWQFAGTGQYDQPVAVQVPHYTQPGQYLVRLVATVGDQTREATATLNVVAKTVLPVVETPDVPLPPADNLYYRNGGVRFGYLCPGSEEVCAETTAELFVDPVAYRTRAITVGALELAGWAEPFEAKPGRRVEGEVRVFRKARRALRAGRTLKGQLHIYNGGSKPVQVRRVLVRIKKPTS